MEEQQLIVDYYKVLKCERTATDDEIKQSYKRLILTTHPDKVGTEDDDSFIQIQKAWSVLKDPSSRKQYDAKLTCQEHSEFLLYDTVTLSEMEFDSEECFYCYPCRCGGTYLLNASDSKSIPSTVVIGCDECSFSIQINKT